MHIQKKKLISFFSPTHLNKTNQYNQVTSTQIQSYLTILFNNLILLLL